MGNTYFKGMVKLTLLLAMCLGCFCFDKAFAANEAVLSGLEIKPSATGSYEVILNTDKPVPIKTKANSSDKLEINLKGVKPSESVNTLYRDVANIDLVLVKPQNDNIQIFIEGKDVASSDISFSSTLLQDVTKTAENEIELNDPLDTYTPVVSTESEEEGNSIYDNVSSLGIMSFLKNTFAKSNMGWLLCLGAMAIFSYSRIRAKKEEEEINIPLAMNKGINRDLRERDLELYGNLSKASSLVEERMRAKRNSSYGIREYQNSQINPNARFNRATPLSPSLTSTKSSLQPRMSSSTKTRTAQSTMQVNKQDTRQAELNLNNIKFLEAMTQIYEKSGRVDLANNLQNQLSQKKKMTMKKYT